MKTKKISRFFSALSLLWFTNIFNGNAQFGANYCAPTFSNGCLNWRSINIMVSNFNWSQETSDNCLLSNFLTDTIYLTAGNNYQMEITNANWCGAAAWLDIGNDFLFDTSDNIFHQYQANETNIYTFNFPVSGLMEPGVYRLRVVTGWGTDCYNQSNNGFGPCGSYEYGNFQDFSVKINSASANRNKLSDRQNFIVYKNRNEWEIKSNLKEGLREDITLYNLQGKLVGTIKLDGSTWKIPDNLFNEGFYIIRIGRFSEIIPLFSNF